MLGQATFCCKDTHAIVPPSQDILLHIELHTQQCINWVTDMFEVHVAAALCLAVV